MLDVVSHELAGLGAADHRGSGSDLLPALHGARPHHRVPRREPHRGRRFPFERRRGTAAHAIAATSASPSRTRALYRSLQRKVEENERLKEFSENIVESINVGILAADLDDRVESWNTQIEQLDRHLAREGRGPDARRTASRRSCASSSTACAARPASITSTSSSCGRRRCRQRQRRMATAMATATAAAVARSPR